MTQVSSVPLTVSTPNTPSPPDQSNCIPRTADSIPKIEEWVQICEKYRDRAYSGRVVGHLEPLSPEDFEGLTPFQYTIAIDNQQDTPCVEHRQNKGLSHDIDGVEDKPNPE
jgi:hypothetical protein